MTVTNRLSLAFGLMVAAVFVVSCTRIGPVVLVLTETHGVHRGDLLIAVPLGLASLALALSAVPKDR